MDHDRDMIRVVEGGGGAIEQSVIEAPLWRRGLPNELGEVVPVFLIAGAAAFSGEIELIPPLEFRLRWQRLLVGLRRADQITAHGNYPFAAFGPQRRHNIGGPRSPIKTGDDCLLDFEGIHQIDDVDRHCRLLAIPERRA